jgi:hypothetical protein
MTDKPLLRPKPRWGDRAYEDFRKDDSEWDAEMMAARVAIAGAFSVDVGFRKGATKWMTRLASVRGMSLEQLVSWLRAVPDVDAAELSSKQREDVHLMLGGKPNNDEIAKAKKAVAYFEGKAADAREKLRLLDGS